MATFNYETGEIIRDKNNVVKNYNEIVNDSLAKEGRKSVKNVETKKSAMSAKRKNTLKRYLAVTLGGVILGIGIHHGLYALGDNIKKDSIQKDLDQYYSNYAYAEIVFNENGEACTAYRTDYTASFLYNNAQELDIESILYFIGDSYYYYPEKTMSELFEQVKRFTPELQGFSSFQDYISSLGFKDFEDYKKGYRDIAINDFEKQAQIHQEDPDYPFKYNFDDNQYYIVSNKDLGGR